MKPLDVNHNPCSSCPYRKDVPPAVWDSAEYGKLREYDNDPPDAPYSIFMCHQGPMINRELVCKGWLDVHPAAWRTPWRDNACKTSNNRRTCRSIRQVQRQHGRAQKEFAGPRAQRKK